MTVTLVLTQLWAMQNCNTFLEAVTRFECYNTKLNCRVRRPMIPTHHLQLHMYLCNSKDSVKI